MFSRSLLALLALGAALPATLAPASAQSAAELTGPQAAPAPPPAAVATVIGADWSRKDAVKLLRYVEGIGSEGLDPADYNVSALRAAINSEDEGLSRIATATFLKVASDLKFGHVRDSGRVDWHVKDDSWNVYDQQALLDRAAKGDVAETFESLLPTHPQYAALKGLLADKSLDSKTRDRVRINLDRWRWLP
ncbi:MAG TPA: hypothetical protein VGB57_03700, partial [Allosphingosinicella sp.]